MHNDSYGTHAPKNKKEKVRRWGLRGVRVGVVWSSLSRWPPPSSRG